MHLFSFGKLFCDFVYSSSVLIQHVVIFLFKISLEFRLSWIIPTIVLIIESLLFALLLICSCKLYTQRITFFSSEWEEGGCGMGVGWVSG